MTLSALNDEIILQALKEDAYKNDVTTRWLVPHNKTSEGYILLKEDAVLCGLGLAKNVFKKLDPRVQFKTAYRDGQKAKRYTKIVFLKGKTSALLTGERTALNFLAHLSGISTHTYRFMQKIRPYKTAILDTRKTTPGLRELEKYAVRCGGGMNHRHNLEEMILIKDNHRKTFLNFHLLTEAVAHLKKKTHKPVVVEINNLNQFKQILKALPDIILLDNMRLSQIKQAVKIVNALPPRRPLLEASGGINLNNVKQIAQTGVDRISIGALTHTHEAINLSMEIIK